MLWTIESWDASSVRLTNYDIADICLFAEAEKCFLSKLDGKILKEHIIDHPFLCENILTLSSSQQTVILWANLNHFSSGKKPSSLAYVNEQASVFLCCSCEKAQYDPACYWDRELVLLFRQQPIPKTQVFPALPVLPHLNAGQGCLMQWMFWWGGCCLEYHAWKMIS